MAVSVVKGFTRGLEAVGVLNRGSAETARPTVPPHDSATEHAGDQQIQSSTLNSTRVVSLVAGIAAVLTAFDFVELLSVNDALESNQDVVVAQVFGRAAIVAAAVLAVAVVVRSDQSARALAASSPAATAQTAVGAGAAGGAVVTPDELDRAEFAKRWEAGLTDLRNRWRVAEARQSAVRDYWLSVRGMQATAAKINPPLELVDEHAIWSARLELVSDDLKKMIGKADKKDDATALISQTVDDLVLAVRGLL